MKPFLKWAGNKYRIVDDLKALFPPATRLIEPFAGSAALSLNSEYDHYIVAEHNLDLITLYDLLKHKGTSFIKDCKLFFTEKIIPKMPTIYCASNSIPQNRHGKKPRSFFISTNMVTMGCVATIVEEFIMFLLAHIKKLIFQKKKCNIFTKNRRNLNYIMPIL